MANTQTSVPVFTAGQVLTAAQQNQINTGIPVFADSTARDAAFGGTGEKTLAEGQFAFLEDSDLTQFYDGSTWQAVGSTSAVVQVKSTAKTDTFSTTSSTFVDVTGLSVSITPTSASNKIMVFADIKLNGQTGTNTAYARLVRDSTAIYVGDAAGSRQQASSSARITTEGVASSGNMFLDSPATTSATTYKVQISVNTASGTIYVNQGSDDTNASTRARYTSSITVMEVTP